MTDRPRVQTVALLGSYVPRQCGIGTFTKDLHDALVDQMGGANVSVLAMDDREESYAYPPEVRFQIPQQRREDYRIAADLLNINQIDAAIIEHEYGIFGGKDGSYVLDFLRRLRMPAVTTMHTVLREPTPGQRAVTRDLLRLSERIVVLSETSRTILQEVYQADPARVAAIPHGIPDVAFTDSAFFKDQFGWEGRTILLTFGLLAPSKGIEVALRALPAVVKRHPELLYVILGATHPHVLRHEGNAYRHSLERLVDKLGLRAHVVFHNRYVSNEELRRYLGTADIYVTPYPGAQQVASGTLAYAVGMGKAVVSTPYVYARELLADDRGVLFPFGDSAALAAALGDLLDDPMRRDALRKRAYLFARPMVWAQVARAHLDLATQIIEERRDHPRPITPFTPATDAPALLAELNLSHLYRMTDDTGMLQHAIYSVPDRHHGYCVDDNARALVAALLCHDLTGDPAVLNRADIYLSFLHHGFNRERGRFRNFMSYDRHWLEEVGSGDVHGRALWALGIAVALAPSRPMLALSTRLFNEALPRANDLEFPRSWAFSLVGIHAYLQRFGGDTAARRCRADLAQRLFERFREHAAPDWPWCEDVVTYDNAKLPHALILAGQWIPDPAMLDQGLRSLQWLVDQQVTPEGNVTLIGNHGWLRRDGQRARFDQQPIEAMAMIEACAEAFRCTQDPVWVQHARRFLGWFTGGNDTHSVLYDYTTAGCCDGLHADGPNLNQGAESTLAWLISLLTVMWLDRAQGVDDTAASRTLAPAGAATADAATQSSAVE